MSLSSILLIPLTLPWICTVSAPRDTSASKAPRLLKRAQLVPSQKLGALVTTPSAWIAQKVSTVRTPPLELLVTRVLFALQSLLIRLFLQALEHTQSLLSLLK